MQGPDMDGMIPLSGGLFLMGSDRFYPEEAPVKTVSVNDFRIDAALVTNRDFAKFVAQTGYRTAAEYAPDPQNYPVAFRCVQRGA